MSAHEFQRGTESQRGTDMKRGSRSRRDNVLPFRPRRRPRIRRLRLHPLRRLLPPFLVALAIVGIPVAVVGWIFHSPAFALTDLELELPENGRVEQRWVRATLDPFLRQNLPRLELAWVDHALTRHPWVEGTELHKELPGRLVVRVLERRAVALYRGGEELCGSSLCYLDQDGESIAPVDFGQDLSHGGGHDLRHGGGHEGTAQDLVLVSSAGGLGPRPALDLAAEIDAVAPSWAAGLSEIEILGVNDFRVWSASLPFPLLVRAGTLETKSRYFEALRPQITRRYERVAAVDLRFARRIIVKPRTVSRERRQARLGAGLSAFRASAFRASAFREHDIFERDFFEKGVG